MRSSKKTKKEKPRLCVFCGEICLFLKDYPHDKPPVIAVHDSCKPFYLLYKKLKKK